MNLTPEVLQLLSFLGRGGHNGYFWTILPDQKVSLWYPVTSIPPEVKDAGHLYFGVHPTAAIPSRDKPERIRAQRGEVSAVNCLFAEFDAKNYGRGKEAAWEAIGALVVPPSIVVDSGGGYHAYWLFAVPFRIAEDADRERAANLQARWVAYVGSDPGAKDLARVLRVPGSWNRKYEPARPVEIVKANWECLYTLDQLEDCLPEAPRRATEAAEPRMTEPLCSNPHDSAERMLQAILRSTAVGHRDADGFNLACQLRDLGLAEIEAQPFMVRYAAGVPASRRNGNDYTERDALRSLKSAFAQPKREPPMLKNSPVIAIEKTSTIVELPAPPEEPPMDNLTHAQPEPQSEAPVEFPSGLDILRQKYDPVVQILPDILPAGMAILAGRAKRGKTTLIYQAAQSICQPGGGVFLGQRVLPGRVLFISLEEWGEAIQERMKDQGWTEDQARNITIVTMDGFRKTFGFLHNKGAAARLVDFVAKNQYRLVVIDTFSKAFLGLRDQDKSEVITPALTPLHQLANVGNFACLFIDHHGHERGFDPDPVNDIMSSSAKAQIADTIIGFYTDGPAKRLLKVTGRRVPDQDIRLVWDGLTRCYQRDTADAAEAELRGNPLKVRRWLREHGPATLTQVSEGTGIAKGNLSPILSTMIRGGFAAQDEGTKVFSCV